MSEAPEPGNAVGAAASHTGPTGFGVAVNAKVPKIELPESPGNRPLPRMHNLAEPLGDTRMGECSPWAWATIHPQET